MCRKSSIPAAPALSPARGVEPAHEAAVVAANPVGQREGLAHAAGAKAQMHARRDQRRGAYGVGFPRTGQTQLSLEQGYELLERCEQWGLIPTAG